MTIASPCPQVLVGERDQYLTLSFCRPERKNALSLAMYSAAAEVLLAADEAPGVRAILLTGSEDSFTSGNDLVDFMNDPEIHEQHPVVRFMRALQHCRKPVVAAVWGSAVGIGTTMLLHCDLVYAAEDARLQLPFVNLGLCPEYAASYLLPKLLGHVKASELLLLGESFTGAQAATLGIVNQAVPADKLDVLVAARLQRLVRQPPAAVRRCKALLKAAQQSSVDAAIAAEFVGFAEGLGSGECKEAVMAFFEKRVPDFSHFE
jgi:enoyl-CoA hydratase/carnithine racemase